MAVAVSGVCAHGEQRGSAIVTGDKVLAAYEAGCAAIESFDVVATVTYHSVLEPIRGRPPHSPFEEPSPIVWRKADPAVVGRRVSRQRFSEGKFRIDTMQIDGRAYGRDSLLCAWNREAFKELSLTDRSGRVQTYGRTQLGVYGMAYQNLFLTFDGNYTYASFMRDRRLTCERDGSCFILTAHPASESKIRASRFGLRLCIDPTRGFMPTRGAYLLDGEPWPQSEWTNELYEPSPGIWVPKGGTVEVILRTNKDSPFAGTPIGRSMLVIDVGSARFNRDIEASVFDVEFPPGLTVLDSVRKTEFVSGPNGTATHLMSLLDPARRAMDALDSKPRSFRWRRIAFFCVNIVLLAAVAGLFLRRRRTLANRE